MMESDLYRVEKKLYGMERMESRTKASGLR